MKNNRILQFSFLLTALLLGTVMAPNAASDLYPCPAMSCSEAETYCDGTMVFQYTGVCYEAEYYPWELRFASAYNARCNGIYFGTCTGI